MIKIASEIAIKIEFKAQVTRNIGNNNKTQHQRQAAAVAAAKNRMKNVALGHVSIQC